MDILLISLAGFIVLVMIMFTYGKRVQMDRIAVLLECKEYEKFDEVVNSLISKILVRHYDLENAKLNSYIIRKDKSDIDKQFTLLLKASQSESRRLSMLIKAFEYYVYEFNKSKSKELLEYISKNASKEIKDYCQREYNILINKSVEYIDELEEESARYDGQRRLISLYLLKLSYENNQNIDKANNIERLLKSAK